MVSTSQALSAAIHRRHSCPDMSLLPENASSERSSRLPALKRENSDTKLLIHDFVPVPAEDAVQVAKSITIPPNANFGTPCLRGHYYPPSLGAPLKAMVVIVPGTGQNANTYAAQAFHLSRHAPEGIGVVVCNKMGHGESEGFRGVFHEQAQVVGNVELFLEKARTLANATLAEQIGTPHTQQPSQSSKNIPLLVYGQSLGGMLTAYALSEQGEALSQQWSDVYGLLHNPWLKLHDGRKPLPWQQSIMEGLLQFSQDAVVCRSGSVWSTLYANLLASHNVPEEHSMIGVVALKLAQNMGQALSEKAAHIRENITVVLSRDDDLVNPDFTAQAFINNANTRIFRWHHTAKADHNQNITPVGALVMTDVAKGILFDKKANTFLLQEAGNSDEERNAYLLDGEIFYDCNSGSDEEWYGYLST